MSGFEELLIRRLNYIEREVKRCLKASNKAGDSQESLGYKTVLSIINNSKDEKRMDYDDACEAKKNRPADRNLRGEPV